MTTPVPDGTAPTRVDYGHAMSAMRDRFAADLARVTAEAVMNQVALDAERAAHAATRAELEALREAPAPAPATDGTTPGADGNAAGEE